jgi:hypothetical protein
MRYIAGSKISLLGLFLLALIILVLTGRARPSHVSPDNSEPTDVGMVSLLAEPHRYDGKFIRTIGFACVEYEGEALYLHKEDYRYSNYGNALALRVSAAQRNQFKSLSLKYVIVEGTLYANGPETPEYAGAIGNITRFEKWRARRDIPAPPEEAQSRCGK